jgi:SAM-dependent methyltransferase
MRRRRAARRREARTKYSWDDWHDKYDNPDSWLARRLRAIQKEIRDAIDRQPPGPIRVLSMCSGDGRDLFEVLEDHPRRDDVVGRLVDNAPAVVERAQANAPSGVEVLCADAGLAGSYEGAVPADLLICCGVLSHVNDADAKTLINGWRALAAPGATVVMNQGGGVRSLRAELWDWIEAAGFRQIGFAEGDGDWWRVAAYEWPGPTAEFRPSERYFTFGTRSTTSPLLRRVVRAYRKARWIAAGRPG